MPKPAGTCGSTKMKILAIICNYAENRQETYGYDIWKTLKDQFHTYLSDNDIGNVYHHLTDLCALEYLTREDEGPEGKCFYRMTDKGFSIKSKYIKYLEIIKNDSELSL